MLYLIIEVSMSWNNDLVKEAIEDSEELILNEIKTILAYVCDGAEDFCDSQLITKEKLNLFDCLVSKKELEGGEEYKTWIYLGNEYNYDSGYIHSIGELKNYTVSDKKVLGFANEEILGAEYLDSIVLKDNKLLGQEFWIRDNYFKITELRYEENEFCSYFLKNITDKKRKEKEFLDECKD